MFSREGHIQSESARSGVRSVLPNPKLAGAAFLLFAECGADLLSRQQLTPEETTILQIDKEDTNLGGASFCTGALLLFAIYFSTIVLSGWWHGNLEEKTGKTSKETCGLLVITFVFLGFCAWMMWKEFDKLETHMNELDKFEMQYPPKKVVFFWAILFVAGVIALCGEPNWFETVGGVLGWAAFLIVTGLYFGVDKEVRHLEKDGGLAWPARPSKVA